MPMLSGLLIKATVLVTAHVRRTWKWRQLPKWWRHNLYSTQWTMSTGENPYTKISGHCHKLSYLQSFFGVLKSFKKLWNSLPLNAFTCIEKQP